MTALCCDEGAKEQEKGCNSGVTHFGSLVVTVWRLGQVCTHTPCCSSMTALCCDEGAKEQEKGCNSGVTHFGSLVVTVGLFSEVLDRRSRRWRIE